MRNYCGTSASRRARRLVKLELLMIRVVIHQLLLAGISLLVIAHPVAAQSSVYIAGAAFAEIKQFDSITNDPRVLAGENDSSLDATGAGGGVRIGTFLHPRWTLELAVDAGSNTTKTMPNLYVSILGNSSALRFPELSASTRFFTVSTIIGFHPAKMGRIQLGYLGGFSFVRGTYESELPDFRILPAGSLTFSSNTSAVLLPTIFPPPTFEFRKVTRVDNSAGAILGLEAAVDLTAHIAAVPGIRAVTFSNSGQTVFLFRPEIGVRWSF
jgi:hypothetical protein